MDNGNSGSLELVDKFCYLGDMSAESVVQRWPHCWSKFTECHRRRQFSTAAAVCQVSLSHRVLSWYFKATL